MYTEYSLNNWCDIEDFYFKTLSEIKSVQEMLKLNEHFEYLKLSLEDYLATQSTNGYIIECYSHFFSLLEKLGSLILSFNYTNTLDYYIGNYSTQKVNYIHGRLKSKDNPIVFGYAADYIQSKELLEIGHNDYLKNIKRYCYNRTNNENKLKSFLEGEPDIDVYIIGHSCGLSDRLILKQIFTHENIRSIRPFYYENYQSYYNLQINIARIIDDDNIFSKLVNFNDLPKMPQMTGSKSDKDSFMEYCSQIEQEVLIFKHRTGGLRIS